MTVYLNMSLEELKQEAMNYYLRHRMNGGASEFDMSVNDISCATIHVFHQQHGQCYLGKVNLYEKEWAKPDFQFTAYEGQKIYNFGCDFVLPCLDEELRLLIIEHNRPKHTFDNAHTWNSVERIFARIEELGGVSLTWS